MRYSWAALLLVAALAVCVSAETHDFVFNYKLGTSNEVINARVTNCDDLWPSAGDGFTDVMVELSLASASNSGTEDIIGIAFDIQNDAVQTGLTIVNITRTTTAGSLSTFTPVFQIAANRIIGNGGGPAVTCAAPGCFSMGFSIEGAKDPNATAELSPGYVDKPYDIGIQVSAVGSGEGIVQAFSFILTAPNTNLDAKALFDNTDWYIRLQSTDLGEESAKTGGIITDFPACNSDEGPLPEGDTTWCSPGYWRQDQHFNSWPASVSRDALYSSLISSPPVSITKLGEKAIREGKPGANRTPTLIQVLRAPQWYGGGPVINAIADLLSEAHCNVNFVTGTSERAPGSCPLNRWAEEDCSARRKLLSARRLLF